MEPSKENVWQRIIDDFKQKDLISIKLLFFVHSSTQSIIYPYITVFMEDLGINTDEIGILAFLISFLGIFLPPITGIIADRIGNFQRLVAVIMVAGGITAFALLLVPKARVVTHYPEKLMVSVDCANTGAFNLTLNENELCYKSLSTQNLRRGGYADCTEKKATSSRNLSVILHACGVMCTDNNSPKQGASLSRTKDYTVSLTGADTGSELRRFAVTGKNFSLTWSAKEGREKMFNTTVQAFSSSKYFFPTEHFLRFTCDNKICSLEKVDDVMLNSSEEAIWLPTLTSKLNKDSVVGEFFYAANKSEDLNCRRQTWKTTVQVNLNSDNNASTEILTFTQCQPQCIAQIERANQCNETQIKQDTNVQLSLYSLLAGRVALAVISGIAFAMVDGAVIGILRTRKADYGLQHVYASLGGMISGQISGLLIDAFSTGKRRNYRPAFFFYALLKFVSAVIIWNIDLEFKAPAKRVLKDVAGVLKKLEVIGLLVVCFMYGISYGVIETYLFPFLKGLDASAGLLGSTILIGKLSGIPFIIFSGPILEYFGHVNVLVVGFIVYAIRLAGYSIITQAWQCLIFEVMESICVSLAFTALVTYAAKLSTSRTDTTIQGLVGGLYHGVGKGVGGIISGFIIKAVCYRKMFRIFGIITVVFSISYFLFYRFCIISNSKKNENEPNASNNSITTTETPVVGMYYGMKLNGEVNPAYVSNEGSPNAEQK